MIIRFHLFILVGCLAAVSTLHAEGKFRAGVAQIDVTPTKAMPMWGYGARHDLLSRGMRDPLYAKAVVIEAGDSRLAIVGLDLGRSLGEPHFGRICEAVKQASQIDHIMMSGSHTHHGPVLELKDAPGQGRGKFDDAVAYVDELEKKLIQVINDAAGKLQDARIGWASAHVDLNRNRHSKREPKPRDTELAVIRLDDSAGKPLVVIVNFAAHPTILAGTDLRWSAEYPGSMMKTVEATIGAACIFMQGAAGDMSAQTSPADNMSSDDPSLADDALDPELTSLLKSTLKIDDDEAKKLQRDMISSGHRMESFGKRMGEEVLRIAKECQTQVPKRPSVTGKYERLDFESRVDFKSLALRALFAVAFFPELAAAASAEQQDNKVHAALTTVLLNDELALVGGSGEFFCDHSQRLKQRSYAAKTLFFGYCNGHNMYFPTIEAASQGGYGADAQMSWVELGAGERMMNQALINIFSMQGKLSKSPLAP
jgi:neutral ceramidase